MSQMVAVTCPFCRRVYQLSEESARQRGRAKCGRCNRTFNMASRMQPIEPAAPAPAPSPSRSEPAESAPPPRAPRPARTTMRAARVTAELPSGGKRQRSSTLPPVTQPASPVGEASRRQPAPTVPPPVATAQVPAPVATTNAPAPPAAPLPASQPPDPAAAQAALEALLGSETATDDVDGVATPALRSWTSFRRGRLADLPQEESPGATALLSLIG